jgi:hypothetical protein
MCTPECPTSRFVDNILKLGTLASILVSASGCSTADGAAAVAPPPADPPSGTGQRHVAVAHKPVGDAAPKSAYNHATAIAGLEPDRLLGLSPQEVLRRLGPPAHKQKGPLSREWVYAAPGCRFQLFFYPNVELTSFKVLKYSSRTEGGRRIDDSHMCVRQILTARNADEHT